jgi:hypothetical protein
MALLNVMHADTIDGGKAMIKAFRVINALVCLIVRNWAFVVAVEEG